MKRNTLTTAVVAGLTGMAGMVSVSNAVNVNPDGMGQVLLYPYYSARGGNDTLISIVNTTERGKAVKIRFREAINSRDVLDFHIYMSPYDVWTAAVTATDAGGAKMVTADNTCTVPYIFGDFDGEQEFLDFEYAETGAETGIDSRIDGGPVGKERTASGYIEVIEMGTMVKYVATDTFNETTGKWLGADGSGGEGIVPYAAKHVKGEPRDCQSLVDAWTLNAPSTAALGGKWLEAEDGDPTFGFDTSNEAITGGLFGSASIINVAEGTMFSYNATAIDNFFTAGDVDHAVPGGENPSLFSRGNVQKSYVFEGGANVKTSEWSTAAGGDEGFGAMLALNAVITNDNLMNEYSTDAAIGGQTEWVVTMPTKRFHSDQSNGGPASASNGVVPPFTREWKDINADIKSKAAKWQYACEDVSFSFWDREESVVQESATPTEPVVSPAPQTPTTNAELFQLCREANVIRFASDSSYPDASGIFKEPKRADSGLGYTNFELAYSEGWMKLDLASIPKDSAVYDKDTNTTRKSLVSNGGEVAHGLPVVGFAVSTYTNGDTGEGVLANYGGTFQHRTSTKIVASSL